MRFVYIFFIAFLWSKSLWGQRTFGSRANDYIWVYNSWSNSHMDTRYTSRIDSNQFVFNGKNYYTFENIKLADSGLKVFGYNGSQEFLLMDYSLEIGDTLHSTYGSANFALNLINKQKVKIENDSLWQFELKSIFHANNIPTFVWVESIGCIHFYHPITWFTTMNSLDLSYTLHCITHNDTSILKPFGKNCAFENSLIHLGKKWHTWASNHNGDLKFSVPYYFTNRDTTLFGKNYQTMNQPNNFVRYDTSKEKYYMLSNKNGEEIMLFNESAKIGDTIYSVFGSYDTVEKIEYMWIENQYHKIYVTPKDRFISGIGWEHRVMWDKHVIVFPEYQSGNICFEDNRAILYHYPFYYQNKNSCVVTSPIQTALNVNLKVYPNPFMDRIFLNTDETLLYEMYTIDGQHIGKGECRNSINMSSLSSGYYLLRLMSRTQAHNFKLYKQ